MTRSKNITGARSHGTPDYLDIPAVAHTLWDRKWMIVCTATLIFALGCALAVLLPSIYQANLLIKVDLGDAAPKNLPASLSGLFELKTASTAELEMLRSRSVVTGAVEASRLYIEAKPRRFPIIGAYFAGRRTGLSEPGLLGYGGFVWGDESIEVLRFDVPASLEKKTFIVRVEGPETYNVQFSGQTLGRGTVGDELSLVTSDGEVRIRVSHLRASRGAEFAVQRFSRVDAVEKLQKALVIAENNKSSGIISVSLQDPDPKAAAKILNEIARQYLAQNIALRSEEARRSLEFVESQLPALKGALEAAESSYSTFRNARGTVDVSEEVKAVLQQSVQTQVRLVELRQRRDELLTRYQNENPLVEAVNQQIRTSSAEIASINDRMRKIPGTEQDAARLTRDVKVNTELYSSLLTTAQQLRLVQASSVGSARLIDNAVVPSTPVKPNRKLIAAAAAIAGLALGIFAALVQRSLASVIRNEAELFNAVDLPISLVVPNSAQQMRLSKSALHGGMRPSLLAENATDDGAMESLRAFCLVVDFAMVKAPNNIIAIVGPTAGVGKTFVAANLAVLMARSGKKVVLIDADLRGGFVHEFFGLKRGVGLVEAVANQATCDKFVNHIAGSLHFISTGELRAQPADCLNSSAWLLLLKTLSAGFDYVVIDTAPILAVADALIVAKSAGLIYCVVRRGVTNTEQVVETEKRLEMSGAPLTGLVFNDAELSDVTYGAPYRTVRLALPAVPAVQRG